MPKRVQLLLCSLVGCVASFFGRFLGTLFFTTSTSPVVLVEIEGAILVIWFIFFLFYRRQEKKSLVILSFLLFGISVFCTLLQGFISASICSFVAFFFLPDLNHTPPASPPADQAALLEAEREQAFQARVAEIKADPQYSTSFKNGLICCESIARTISQILMERGGDVDIKTERDMGWSVYNNYYEEECLKSKRGSTAANKKMRDILKDLQANKDHSPFYHPLLTTIRNSGIDVPSPLEQFAIVPVIPMKRGRLYCSFTNASVRLLEGGSYRFFSSLPFVRDLSQRDKILLFFIFKYISLLILWKLTHYVFMMGGSGNASLPSGGEGQFNIGSSGSSNGPNDTADINILLESSSEDTGSSSVNQPSAGHPAVAAPEEAAGPERVEPFPYQDDEMIGGDSVEAIKQRFVNRLREKNPDLEAIDYQLAEEKARDIFEKQVEIIRYMSAHHPEGDWLRRGAHALKNNRTPTGDQSFAKLSSLLDDLTSEGVRSRTFYNLKSKVFAKKDFGNDDSFSQS